MTKLFGFLGLTIGGWLGWALGARISFTAALFLSILGSALGLYVGQRIARDHF